MALGDLARPARGAELHGAAQACSLDRELHARSVAQTGAPWIVIRGGYGCVPNTWTSNSE
jgi:hypothetical protein